MAVTRTMTNAWKVKTLPDIFYEDPEPIEDGMLQDPFIRRIAYLLAERYEDAPDVFVSSGGFVFYNPENGNQRIAPDCYIAFDVDVKAIYENLPNYWIWEVGKPPDFVLEVASKSTADRDLGEKRELYERLRIAEYWRMDPTGGALYGQPLAGERLVDGKYAPYELELGAEGAARGYSALLDVVFCWDGEEFDALDPVTGRTIGKREAAEAHAQVQARARLDAEARAESERQARLEAEAELARLRAQLRGRG